MGACVSLRSDQSGFTIHKLINPFLAFPDIGAVERTLTGEAEDLSSKMTFAACHLSNLRPACPDLSFYI